MSFNEYPHEKRRFMAGELIVPTTKKPTFWNRDAAVGYFTGTLIPLPFAGFVGMAIGGVLGKQRMTQDAAVGKLVGKPTIWNKTMLLGAGIGRFIVAGAATVAILSGVPLFTSLVVGGAVALAAGAIGAVIGGIKGKERLTREYNDAVAYEQQQETSLAKTLSPQAGRGNQISAEESAQLDARLSEGKSTGFVDKLNAEQAMQQTAAR